MGFGLLNGLQVAALTPCTKCSSSPMHEPLLAHGGILGPGLHSSTSMEEEKRKGIDEGEGEGPLMEEGERQISMEEEKSNASRDRGDHDRRGRGRGVLQLRQHFHAGMLKALFWFWLIDETMVD